MNTKEKILKKLPQIKNILKKLFLKPFIISIVIGAIFTIFYLWQDWSFLTQGGPLALSFALKRLEHHFTSSFLSVFILTIIINLNYILYKNLKDIKKENKLMIFFRYFTVFFMVPATILLSPGIIQTIPKQITPGLQDTTLAGPFGNNNGIFECEKFLDFNTIGRVTDHCTFKDFFMNEIVGFSIMIWVFIFPLGIITIIFTITIVILLKRKYLVTKKL